MSVPAPQILISGHDSAKFKEQHKADPTIPFESEGGWVLSRPRHTRRPPIVFTLGFTDISEAEKEELKKLYADTRGSSDMITGWIHPTTQDVLNVRFKQGSMPQYNYRGYGGNHRWDVSGVILEEV